MAMMDTMVKSISKDKREQMMVDMMPMMMEGMDINDLMPRMMVAMFKDVTADDVAAYLKETLQDQRKTQRNGRQDARGQSHGQDDDAETSEQTRLRGDHCRA
jgi:DNA-binding ferritin-like protein (Dps family)